MEPIIPTPDLELPATELIDHDNGLFVRCPANGQWVEFRDYHSEKPGQLLPIVGRVAYEEDTKHWIDTGERDANDQPIMKQVEKDNAVTWNAIVRILAPVETPAPEGGTLEMNVAEDVAMSDKMA